MPPEADDLVFIVDDDEGVRLALQMLVRSLGLRSKAFGSGEEFLDAYDVREGGCLLLDVRMPGMSGFEVRQRLDAIDAPIPVIFLTAHADAEAPGWIGSAERIQKPFRDEELVDRLLELTGGSDD